MTKRLLEELKRVVECLQGRTDSMIFILNRVDQRGADDLPLSVRIDKLREEIKQGYFILKSYLSVSIPKEHNR